MPEFLYVFGYETPEQAKANAAHGWDDEDSEAVFIEAESADAALDWGRQISEHFIRQLYHCDNASWWRTSFAHWIAEQPESKFTPEALSSIPHVRYGEHPIFKGTRNAYLQTTPASWHSPRRLRMSKYFKETGW